MFHRAFLSLSFLEIFDVKKSLPAHLTRYIPMANSCLQQQQLIRSIQRHHQRVHTYSRTTCFAIKKKIVYNYIIPQNTPTLEQHAVLYKTMNSNNTTTSWTSTHVLYNNMFRKNIVYKYIIAEYTYSITTCCPLPKNELEYKHIIVESKYCITTCCRVKSEIPHTTTKTTTCCPLQIYCPVQVLYNNVLSFQNSITLHSKQSSLHHK
jgi:hypothetical protein